MPEPVVFYELPYAQYHDAQRLFAPFCDEPWALFLDSAGAEHPNSRFDILLRQPIRTFCYRHQETTAKDPFAALDAWLGTPAPVAPDYEHLPFQGGLAGLFGYDAGHAIETLPDTHTADIPLADIAVGYYVHALVIDHQRQQVTAIQPPGFSQSPAEFWRGDNPQVQPFRLTSPWQSNMNRDLYTGKIQQIHEYLRAGDCYQINLAQRFQAQFKGHPWQAYVALRETNQAPFSAYFNLPEGQILSVSPERFLQTHADGQVETRPIKGTRPRHADPAVDAEHIAQLRASEKDQAENLMIVDLLRNDLSRVCLPGSVYVPELFAIESFHAVHHSVSTVRGRLHPDCSALALIRAAFPGGSITGAPKIRAMEIIDELEPHKRSIYCGSIGYFSQHGHSDTSITIRTLCCVDGHIYCWAGGGIVIDSDADSEYQETFDKVARILPVLEQINCGTDEAGNDA
ncbi:aminodeoxychorismate synthase component I [Aliidiomarina halalkaliphila]|uniref:aminodeoxychorismate synthase n=1 Tax=Aliidiomarina halalkaliphila TaxID=2593535 RepID=A0A552X639_9GAMM|nr:aminodeoxychorismate synthase component I [Aliidiomarina halalkaliphila]TRW50033.1 aminodeoxychorismate synthase component I [Aliidiomarina halalkaliphila]